MRKTNGSAAVFVTGLIVMLCTGSINAQKHSITSDSLSVYLKTADYLDVFLLGEHSKSDSLWELDTTGVVLRSIVEGTAFDNRTRFLATEILLEHSNWRPGGALKLEIALIYAEALRENYTGVANPWGLPDDLGSIGRRVVIFGDTAMIAFYPLLKCDTGLRHIRSKVSTMGKIYKYRVKDVAATYIAYLLKMNFNAERAPWRRNITIGKIKRAAQKHIS